MIIARLLVELTLPEEFPTLSDEVECLPYIPCHEDAAVECQFLCQIYLLVYLLHIQIKQNWVKPVISILKAMKCLFVWNQWKKMLWCLPTSDMLWVKEHIYLKKNTVKDDFLCLLWQGEWEGNVLDLVLAALQSFPKAAFLGFTFSPTSTFSSTSTYSLQISGQT